MPISRTKFGLSFFLPRALTARTFFAAVWLITLATTAAPQSGRKVAEAAVAAPPLVRTTTRREVRRIGYGGTLTVLGAPAGSITIEAWPRSEVEVVADIEWRADTEEDLTRLARVNNFFIDADSNHLRVVTTGTHDRKFMKAVDKNFPKKLLGLPWKVDYRIRVPALFDVEVYAGRGALNLAGIEGEIRLNAAESTATLTLMGGSVAATIGRGSVIVRIPQRSWRGRGADVRLATGDMIIELPPGFNGDLNLDVLRTGSIDNGYSSLVPHDEAMATPRSLHGRAGAGGAMLSFAVADGTLHVKQVAREEDR